MRMAGVVMAAIGFSALGFLLLLDNMWRVDTPPIAAIVWSALGIAGVIIAVKAGKREESNSKSGERTENEAEHG